MFYCFEFDNEYGRIFSKGYDKVDGETINDKLRYVNSQKKNKIKNKNKKKKIKKK